MAYFEHLPVISYNGTISRNLLAKASLTDAARKQQMVYHPYTMRDDDRPDILAYRYYDNAKYAWLVWFSNDTVDPYYDLGMSEDDFQNYIIKKYGSAARAQTIPVYYTNNWVGDNTILTIAQYNSLVEVLKQYWDPVTDQYGTVNKYMRKKKDMYRSTNKIIYLNVSSTTGFYLSEVIRYINNGGIVASAVITYIDTDNNIITAQHVTGQFSQGNSITGYDSKATTIVQSQTLLQQTISDVEAIYWAPVSAYDRAHELNQSKKNIRLIDNQLATAVENQIVRVFGQ
jgi:Base plate wedge protein 53